ISLGSAHFDAARCQRGIDALRSYCADWDEHLRTFRKTPKHDWASHGSDAFRYLAMSWREPMAAEEAAPNPIKELLRKKSLAEQWSMFIDEQIERGEEF